MSTKPYQELRKKLTDQQRAASACRVDAMKIGMIIRDQRLKVGLTQTDLAELLGITQQAVSKIEQGENIELPTLTRVFKALKSELYVHTPDAQIPLTHAAG